MRFPLARNLVLVILIGCWHPAILLAETVNPSLASKTLLVSQPVSRIAYGSCYRPRNSDHIFKTILNEDPDLFLLMGDNVYADTEEDDSQLTSLREAYATLENSESFRKLRENVPLLATWDDHDYGLDDAGADWPHRDASLALFDSVWNSSRSERQVPGVYQHYLLGPIDQRVNLILLDTRYFRSAWLAEEPNMLGDTQWRWLEEKLAEPARLTILVSSIQLLGTGYSESWSRMQSEQYRLLNLLSAANSQQVIVLSGDLHSGAFYEFPLYAKTGTSGVKSLVEATASSLNDPVSGLVENIVDGPDFHRLGLPYHEANFGLLEIDWENNRISLQIKDDGGDPVRVLNLPLQASTP